MTLLELFEDRPQSQKESSEEWYNIFGEYLPKSVYPGSKCLSTSVSKLGQAYISA